MGRRVAQSVKCPTFDFGSGHGLTVRELEPHIGLCADSVEPAWEMFYLFINKYKLKKKGKDFFLGYFSKIFVSRKDNSQYAVGEKEMLTSSV